MKKNLKFIQGKYIPKNLHKYRGDFNNIYFRSLWEYHLFRWLDASSKVVEWGSETVVIPYLNPFTGRQHRYFVDLYAKILDKDGVVRKYLIEVKPHKETIPPKTLKDSNKYSMMMAKYKINLAKWKAAEAVAKENDMKFIILTEKELYGK